MSDGKTQRTARLCSIYASGEGRGEESILSGGRNEVLPAAVLGRADSRSSERISNMPPPTLKGVPQRPNNPMPRCCVPSGLSPSIVCRGHEASLGCVVRRSTGLFAPSSRVRARGLRPPHLCESCDIWILECQSLVGGHLTCHQYILAKPSPLTKAQGTPASQAPLLGYHPVGISQDGRISIH